MDMGSDGAVKLEVRDLSIYFDDLHVLDNISFQLAEGDFVSLLGPSGCGKSTLLNLVAGLLAPTSGTMARDGIEVTAPGPDRSMVFQDDAVFPWYTVVTERRVRPPGQGSREDESDVRRRRVSSTWSVCRAGRMPTRTSCRAGCASVWMWPAPWPPSRTSC